MVYYRRNLWVLSLTNFFVACCWNQVIPFLPLFIKELGVKNGVAFWSGMTLAAQTIAMIVMLPYWGKLADKYGPKLMILRAGACSSLIYLGMAYCQSLWQLLLLRFLTGLLVGFIPASITMVATNTPKLEATRYVAVIQSVVAFGNISGPPVGGVLANWMGYRSSMLISFVVVAMAVMLVYLLVEDQQRVSVGSEATSLWQDLRLAFKKPVLITALCSDMTYGFVTMASQPVLILYIQDLIGGRVNLFTGPIFALPGLAIVMTNYCWCRLGEHYTFPRIILLGLTGAGAFIFLQGLVRNVWWFAAAYFLAGLFAAAVSPNTAGLITTKVETDFQGRAFAIQQGSRNLGNFLGPMLAGILGGLFSLQWVFIAVGLLGLAAAVAIKLQVSKWKSRDFGSTLVKN